MPTTIIDEGDGTTTTCHVTYNGTEGPFLTPVGETFVDAEGTTVSAVPLRTSSQLVVESAPSDDNHVLRRIDFTDGSLTELIIGDLRIRSVLNSGIGYIDLRTSPGDNWATKITLDLT